MPSVIDLNKPESTLKILKHKFQPLWLNGYDFSFKEDRCDPSKKKDIACINVLYSLVM